MEWIWNKLHPSKIRDQSSMHLLEIIGPITYPWPDLNYLWPQMGFQAVIKLQRPRLWHSPSKFSKDSLANISQSIDGIHSVDKVVCTQYNRIWRWSTKRSIPTTNDLKDMSGHLFGYNLGIYKTWEIYVNTLRPEQKWSPCPSCQIRKIAGCACAGNAGNVFPATAG